MNNFDPIVTGSIELAQTEAIKRKHNELTEYHLLWGLIKNPNTIASKQLKSEKKILIGLLDQLPTVGKISLSEIKPSPNLSEWFTLASSEAIQAGRDTINEADLLRNFTKYFPQLKVEIPEDQETEQPDFLINLNELAEKA